MTRLPNKTKPTRRGNRSRTATLAPESPPLTAQLMSSQTQRVSQGNSPMASQQEYFPSSQHPTFSQLADSEASSPPSIIELVDSFIGVDSTPDTPAVSRNVTGIAAAPATPTSIATATPAACVAMPATCATASSACAARAPIAAPPAVSPPPAVPPPPAVSPPQGVSPPPAVPPIDFTVPLVINSGTPTKDGLKRKRKDNGYEDFEVRQIHIHGGSVYFNCHFPYIPGNKQ